MIHVQQLTQPQGHSTSGSHERYKNKERLAWETEYDCNAQMRKWMIENNIATDDELSALERDIKKAEWIQAYNVGKLICLSVIRELIKCFKNKSL